MNTQQRPTSFASVEALRQTELYTTVEAQYEKLLAERDKLMAELTERPLYTIEWKTGKIAANQIRLREVHRFLTFMVNDPTTGEIPTPERMVYVLAGQAEQWERWVWEHTAPASTNAIANYIKTAEHETWREMHLWAWQTLSLLRKAGAEVPPAPQRGLSYIGL